MVTGSDASPIEGAPTGLAHLIERYATNAVPVNDGATAQHLLMRALMERLEPDPSKITDADRHDDQLLSTWEPTAVPMTLTCSPLMFRPDGTKFVVVSGIMNVGSAVDERHALGYINAHAAQASTTYAWVYDQSFSIWCTTSVVVNEGDARSMDLARAVLWETYSAGCGKASSIAADGTGAGYTAVRVRGGARRIDPENPPAVLLESVRLHEYGTLEPNPWTALPGDWVKVWLRSVLDGHLDDLVVDTITAPELLPLVPLLEFLGRDDAGSLYVTGVLTVVPDVNPYIGPGVRITLDLPHQVLDPLDALRLCNAMNRHELATPSQGISAAGSWMLSPHRGRGVGDRAYHICYTSFYASAYAPVVDLADTAEQMLRRAQHGVRLLGTSRVDDTEFVDVELIDARTPWPMSLYAESVLEHPHQGTRDGATIAVDGGHGWSQLREIIQQRLTLDDEWVTDEPERLRWWPTSIPVEVSVPMFHPPQPDSPTVRLVRVQTVIGSVPTASSLVETRERLSYWNFNRPGGAATVDDNGLVTITFSLPFSSPNLHQARAITNAMALQSSYGLALRLWLDQGGLIEGSFVGHPLSGVRRGVDEIARLYLPGGDGPALFDVVEFCDDSVRGAYEQLMSMDSELEAGWSDAEAVFFQRRDDDRVAVGMGVLTAAESEFGSGVRYTGTLSFAMDARKTELIASLCNSLNLALTYAPEASGRTVPITGAVQPVPFDDETVALQFESFIPADVLKEYNTPDTPAAQRAALLAYYAMAALHQTEYLRALLDDALGVDS